VEVFVVRGIAAVDPLSGMQEFFADHEGRGCAVRNLGQSNGAAGKGNAGVRSRALIFSERHLVRPQRIVGIQPRRTFAVFVPLLVASVGGVVGLGARGDLVEVLVRGGSDGPNLRLTARWANV